MSIWIWSACKTRSLDWPKLRPRAFSFYCSSEMRKKNSRGHRRHRWRCCRRHSQTACSRPVRPVIGGGTRRKPLHAAAADRRHRPRAERPERSSRVQENFFYVKRVGNHCASIHDDWSSAIAIVCVCVCVATFSPVLITISIIIVYLLLKLLLLRLPICSATALFEFRCYYYY